MSENPVPLTLDEALDKVEARFLYNLPADELSNIERLFFQIEQAHWFYEDFIADDPLNSHLPKFRKLQSFADILFKRCALLIPLKNEQDILFNDFCKYRYQIPVCGCILVNREMTHVVLVRNWAGNSWSWPKGKINEGESPFDCGIRETLEETGYNAVDLCSEDQFLEVHEDSKVTKLFIAIGVPNDTMFETQTRKEISRVEFHPLQQLPKKVWGVQPFIPKLQRFLRKFKRRKSGPDSASQKKSSAPPPSSSFFDNRNVDTFGASNGGGDEWSVDDMFIANAKLTGKTCTYDGNPHSFGSRHPSYVNYRDEGSHTSSPVTPSSPTLPDDVRIPEDGRELSQNSCGRDQSSGFKSENITTPAFPSKFCFDKKKIQTAVARVLDNARGS